jgi:hypothetical protein
VARTILGFTETQEARPLPTSPARP